MRSESELIEMARRKLNGLELVHVDEPSAAQGFRNGKVMFDVSDGAHKLVTFFQNHPELDADRAESKKGFFPVQSLGGDGAVYVAVKRGYHDKLAATQDLPRTQHWDTTNW